MKNFFKVVFSRAVFTGAFIALQFAAVYLAITRFNEHFAIFYGVCLVLSAVVVVYLVSRDGNPAYKIAWIIPILALPVFGVLLYLVFGKNQLSLKEKARMSSVAEQYEKAMRSVPAAEPALPEHTDAKRVSDYLHRAAGAPVFTHTETTYLPVGEVYFDTRFWRSWKRRRSSFSWSTTSSPPARCGTPFTRCCAARRKAAWMCA